MRKTESAEKNLWRVLNSGRDLLSLMKLRGKLKSFIWRTAHGELSSIETGR